ncbi:hypothetical protein HHK36_025157 [Tetracentron sinense]|uniref:Peptidase M28 domain-containing protein n=1 Tax=Tetracentron sinense TaxID=13715 RepID=A0A834YPC3_TETSI|nr:hypothetical protein HHK36_025157 [Tetracentron sinense]
MSEHLMDISPYEPLPVPRRPSRPEHSVEWYLAQIEQDMKLARSYLVRTDNLQVKTIKELETLLIQNLNFTCSGLVQLHTQIHNSDEENRTIANTIYNGIKQSHENFVEFTSKLSDALDRLVHRVEQSQENHKDTLTEEIFRYFNQGRADFEYVSRKLESIQTANARDTTKILSDVHQMIIDRQIVDTESISYMLHPTFENLKNELGIFKDRLDQVSTQSNTTQAIFTDILGKLDDLPTKIDLTKFQDDLKRNMLGIRQNPPLQTNSSRIINDGREQARLTVTKPPLSSHECNMLALRKIGRQLTTTVNNRNLPDISWHSDDKTLEDYIMYNLQKERLPEPKYKDIFLQGTTPLGDNYEITRWNNTLDITPDQQVISVFNDKWITKYKLRGYKYMSFGLFQCRIQGLHLPNSRFRVCVVLIDERYQEFQKNVLGMGELQLQDNVAYFQLATLQLLPDPTLDSAVNSTATSSRATCGISPSGSQDTDPSLLVNGHFDSPLGSPGAGDCASCVDLVCQSGPGSWPSLVYAQSAIYPMAHSAAQDVFPVIPGDTDYRIFAEDYGDIPGLDIIFLFGGYYYHTSYDTPERLLPGSIQARGDNLFSLIKAFTSSSELRNARERVPLSVAANGTKGAVFFDYLSWVMIFYSRSKAVILHSLPIVIFLLMPFFLRFPKVGVQHWFATFCDFMKGMMFHALGVILAIIVPIIFAILRLLFSSYAMSCRVLI